MSKPSFSFALIMRNESKTLPRLIESLKEFQDRGGVITVLDTGSTDRSAEIARSMGCIVHEVGDRFRRTITGKEATAINELFVVDGEENVVADGDSLFDYSSSRNYVASLAPTNMIATPDCDEVWTRFDIDAIEKHIADGIEQLEYNFVFAHDEFGKPAIQFTHCKFYDRRKLKWVRIVHEVLQGSARRKFVDESVAKLEHFQNHETNRSGYLKGLALDCYEDRASDRNSHYFARELMWTGRFRSAIKEFKRHITMGGWQPEASQSEVFIGDCYAQLGEKEESLSWYLKAHTREPYRREPLMRIADHYYRYNQPKQAIPFAEGALTVGDALFYSNHQPYYTDLPHAILYWAYHWTGNLEKAKEHWKKALAFSPTNPRYRQDQVFYWDSLPLVSIVIPTLGREAGLQRCVESIYKSSYKHVEVNVIHDEPRKGVPRRVAQGLAWSKGEWICYLANDTELEEHTLFNAYLDHLATGKRLIAFNDGELLHDRGNVCCHFMIHRSLIDEIGGEIFDTGFNHVGVDNLLWSKCDALGEAFRSTNATMKHYHFSNGGAEWDEVYALGWSQAEGDRKKLQEQLG